MDIQNRIQSLRILNYLKIEGSLEQDLDKNTDLVFISAISRFLTKFEKDINHKATFIVKYDNDVYSALALHFIHIAAIARQKTIDIRLMGELSEEEKDFFKDFKTIGYKRASKMKNKILITGFNPILNVINTTDLSKNFPRQFNPIEDLSPVTIDKLMDFYLNKTSSLYNTYIKKNEMYKFYTLPVGFNGDKETLYKWYLESIKNIADFKIYILSGTEKDFKTYDDILKSSKEGYIHLYIIPEDKISFVQQCLMPHVTFSNVPQEINIVSQEEAINIVEEVNCAEHEVQVINYESFLKQEDINEDSNS